MLWDAGRCRIVLKYGQCDGEERVSPGDGSELGVLSLRISWLVISCCIRRNVFFSSFHVLFKKLSYPVSAANSLNVICLSIAPPPPSSPSFFGSLSPSLSATVFDHLTTVCVCACLPVHVDAFQQFSSS